MDTVARPEDLYLSTEIEAYQQHGGGFVLRRADGAGASVTITEGIGRGACRMSRTRAWAIMLELDEGHRIALGLPPCEAVTGGTALCLARSDKAATGEVPTPSAPTCWAELVSAELWAMGWLGRSDGVEASVTIAGPGAA